MPINVTCRRCQHEFDAPDRSAGEEMDCPSCGAAVMVPSPGRMRQEEDRSRSAPTRRQLDEEDEDRPQRRRVREGADEQPGTGVQLGLGIAGLVVGILSAFFAMIPCLGMFSVPFSSIALLLALIGLTVACFRKGRGLGFPIAGSLVSLVALGIGIAQIVLVSTTVKQAAKDAEEMGKQMQEQKALTDQQRKKREAEIEKQNYKPGKPLAGAWEDDVAYLCELVERDVRVAPGQRLGKRGMLGLKGRFGETDREMLVDGKTDPRGLSLEPPRQGTSSVKYQLNGEAVRLLGAVALNDPRNPSDRPTMAVTFEILGDGKKLWTSNPIQKRGDKQAFDVDVKGVKEIELQARYPGFDSDHVHALWLEARVTRDKEAEEKKWGNAEQLPDPEVEMPGEELPPPKIEKDGDE